MKCVVCNKFFIDGEKVTKYMATTNVTKSKIAFYLFTGAMNNRMIADMFGVSRNTVIGVKKKLKIQMENNAAKIAAEQAKVFRTLNMYAEDEAEDAKLQSKELKRMRRKHATNNINE
jgi:transposase